SRPWSCRRVGLTMSSATPSVERRRRRRERRAHIRHSSSDLPSIRGSRLRHGPTVELIDLSAGGALLTADIQMKPGARLALEIASGDDEPSLVAMRVLRCEVATLRPEATIYRGACVFARPLNLPILMPEP